MVIFLGRSMFIIIIITTRLFLIFHFSSSRILPTTTLMADNRSEITLSPARRLVLADLLSRKVQHALCYDSWNKNNIKITIDIYSEAEVREWGLFLGIRSDLLNLSFEQKKLGSKVTRVFWKKKYSSVEEIRGLQGGWWVRHHGRFRTVVLVKKEKIFQDSDPGIEVSLWGSQVCSYMAKGLAEEDIDEGSKSFSTLFYLSLKLSTRLLRIDDPIELQQIYTGESL